MNHDTYVLPEASGEYIGYRFYCSCGYKGLLFRTHHHPIFLAMCHTQQQYLTIHQQQALSRYVLLMYPRPRRN